MSTLIKMGPFKPPLVRTVKGQWEGFALENAREGETGTVETCGFHSFDEGIPFYRTLDALNPLLLEASIQPSSVGGLLLVLEPGTTTIYTDGAFGCTALVRARRAIQAGEAVGPADIANIERVQLHGVSIPDNAGFLWLMSHNWRRAYFFDFRPCGPGDYKRDYDLEVAGGQLLSHLWFTEYFLLSELEWNTVIGRGWFPFMHLIGRQWDRLFDAIKKRKPLEDEEQDIFESFATVIDSKLQSWITKPILETEEPFLTRAVAAFKTQDWVTVISLVAQRIEGILRRSFSSYGKNKELIESLRTHLELTHHQKSLLFPAQLERYFLETFLQYVDFSTDSSTVNRHTICHGIAAAENMDRSHGLRLMLLVDHLFYCLPA